MGRARGRRAVRVHLREDGAAKRWHVSTPHVRKVLCTIAIGRHRELLEITQPSFDRYADRHGYDVVVVDRTLAPTRAPSWSKVPLLHDLVQRYDVALWVDCDATIVDDSVDIADVLEPPLPQPRRAPPSERPCTELRRHRAAGRRPVADLPRSGVAQDGVRAPRVVGERGGAVAARLPAATAGATGPAVTVAARRRPPRSGVEQHPAGRVSCAAHRALPRAGAG